MLKANSLAKLILDGPRALLWQLTGTSSECWLNRILELSILEFAPYRLQSRVLFQIAKESPGTSSNVSSIMRTGILEKSSGTAIQPSEQLGRNIVSVDYAMPGNETLATINIRVSDFTSAVAHFPFEKIDLEKVARQGIMTAAPASQAAQVIRLRLVASSQTLEIGWWTSSKTKNVDKQWWKLWHTLGEAEVCESLAERIRERFEMSPLGDHIDVDIRDISQSCNELMAFQREL